MLRRGGTANIIGMIPVGQIVTLMGAAFLGEKRIQGSLMGSNRFPVDMPRLVDFYMSGKLKLDDMISRRIKLEQVNEAFEEMKTRRDRPLGDRLRRIRPPLRRGAAQIAQLPGFPKAGGGLGPA